MNSTRILVQTRGALVFALHQAGGWASSMLECHCSGYCRLMRLEDRATEVIGERRDFTEVGPILNKWCGLWLYEITLKGMDRVL